MSLSDGQITYNRNSNVSNHDIQAYARSRSDVPELMDIVAVNANTELPVDEEGQRAAKRQRLYADHKPMSSISEGMKQGRLHQVGLL